MEHILIGHNHTSPTLAPQLLHLEQSNHKYSASLSLSFTVYVAWRKSNWLFFLCYVKLLMCSSLLRTTSPRHNVTCVFVNLVQSVWLSGLARYSSNSNSSSAESLAEWGWRGEHPLLSTSCRSSPNYLPALLLFYSTLLCSHFCSILNNCEPVRQPWLGNVLIPHKKGQPLRNLFVFLQKNFDGLISTAKRCS